MNPENYLDAEEARISIEEGHSKKAIVREFKITIQELNALLSGKKKRVKIGKNSPWYDHEGEKN